MRKRDLLKRIEELERRLSAVEARGYWVHPQTTTPNVPYTPFVPWCVQPTTAAPCSPTWTTTTTAAVGFAQTGVLMN